MNRIEKLIEEMCPEGVPKHRLDEVYEIRGGYTPSKTNSEYWEEGSIPWFRMDDIRSSGRILSSSSQLISKSAVKTKGLFPAGSIIMSTSATIGEHALVKVPFVANQRFSVLVIRDEFAEKLDMKFAFYLGFGLAEYCKKNTSVSGFASVVMPAFKSYLLPVPPLQIQKEIVTILDKFTQLEAELEAELEARDKQYEEVRRRLLDFESDTSNHPLGEMIMDMCPEGVDVYKLNSICSKVQSVSWSEHTGQTFEYIDLSSVDIKTGRLGQTKRVDKSNAPSRARQIVEKNDLLFATTRPTQMRLHLVAESSKYIASTGYSVIRVSGEEIDPKFIFFCLSTNEFYRYVENNQTLGNYPSISDSTVKEFGIRLPPLEIQKEIVRILDNLDSLVNSVNEGIPAEIAARRKQYEYYRDKLLTFKELDAA